MVFHSETAISYIIEVPDKKESIACNESNEVIVIDNYKEEVTTLKLSLADGEVAWQIAYIGIAKQGVDL